MIDQDLNVADEAANETSLRDELAATFSKLSEDPAPVEEAAPVEEETAEEAEQRARDELGRFAKKEGEETAQTDPEAQETEETKADRYAGPPPGWSIAAKAAHSKAASGEPLEANEVQAILQAVSKREQEVDQGFAKLKEYNELQKTIEPYQQTARQYGVDLPELLNRYDAAEKFLQQDPHNAIRWLCQSYGVDPRALAGQPQAAQQQQQQQIDPAMQPLLQEINSLKQQLGRVDQIEQSLYADKFGQVSNQVESFFTDPSNKFSEDVADQMVLLINEAHARGEQPNLTQIYETACYMHPEVRQALINEKLTADQKARAAKATQAANQARQAGASISGAPSASQPTGEPDSENLRALLEQNFAAQMGRI